MTERLENTILWIFGIKELLKRVYLRAFPLGALVFAFYFCVGIAGRDDLMKLSARDVPSIFAIAIAFTFSTMLYGILYWKERAEE